MGSCMSTPIQTKEYLKDSFNFAYVRIKVLGDEVLMASMKFDPLGQHTRHQARVDLEALHDHIDKMSVICKRLK